MKEGSGGGRKVNVVPSPPGAAGGNGIWVSHARRTLPYQTMGEPLTSRARH